LQIQESLPCKQTPLFKYFITNNTLWHNICFSVAKLTAMKKLSILLFSVIAVLASSCIEMIDPRASFEVSKNNVNPYEEIEFYNSSHHAMSYEWDFGDGCISNEYEPVHYYTRPGSYSVG